MHRFPPSRTRFALLAAAVVLVLSLVAARLLDAPDVPADVVVVLLGAALLLWIADVGRAARANEALRCEIAERKRVEEALRESETKLRTLVRHFPNGAVFLFDRDLRYLVADGRALELYGFTSPEVEGRTLQEVLEPEAVRRLAPVYRATLAGETPPEFQYQHNDRTLHLVGVPVRDDTGAVIAGMLIALDITDFRQAEEERKRIERKLQDTQRLESLGLLAGGIAHDFNNLLAAILGHADVVRLDVPPGSETAESVDAIIAGVRRAAEMTNRLLAYAGKGHFVLRPVLLNDVLRELDDLMRVSMGQHAQVELDLAEDLPAIEADAAQLRQVALNLLVNASEAIDPGTQGTVTVSTRAEELDDGRLAQLAPNGERAPGRYVRLSVKDTGCGMDAETLARIFDPFFTTKFAGRGLGLAAVHGIVRGHRGMMEVESEPGRGTTFHIWFPATEAAAPRAEPPATATCARRGTALVVDDEPAVRAAFARVLKRLGFDVRMAEDGPAALEALRAGIPDLVVAFVDLTMPLMPGDVLARAIRECRPDIPLILMSGYTAEDVAARHGDVGHAVFLHKPFTLEALREALRCALEGKGT
ncbi:hybrid sensor histidine kinase/response regulator [Polyangium aurulentum]|uniref:hybrid sensor histidine kinase/response regulator n=1 Tax=Polyangium aurulentum TaxID=2567896 RepID=UPI00146C7245|nr:PAS domain-containing sensor histidine kinase [Polyangium aurulentum]UQA62258.1 response regulator [Polyangium aurulentum]